MSRRAYREPRVSNLERMATASRRADRLVESIERRAEAFDAEIGHAPAEEPIDDERQASAQPTGADE